MCKRRGGYSGGLAVVAANTRDEAFEVFHSSKDHEWMQNTMIEKACQWLFENVYDYLNPEDQERVESFRKYLEE